MNFKKWLLKESKAITLPPEVLSFIDQITPEITKLMLDSKEKGDDGCYEIRKLNKKWNIKVPIQSKYYDKFDYEKTGIKYRPVEKYIPMTVVLDCNFENTLGHFSISDSEIKINSFRWGKQRDGSHGKHPISIEAIKNTLTHEFVHAIDIKNHDKKIDKALEKKYSAGRNAQNKNLNPEIIASYYGDPVEQDGHMGAMTQEIISYANASIDHQNTHQDLEKILDFIKSTEKYRGKEINLPPLLPKDIRRIYTFIDIGDKTIKRRVLSRIYDAVMQAKTIIQKKQRIES